MNNFELIYDIRNENFSLFQPILFYFFFLLIYGFAWNYYKKIGKNKTLLKFINFLVFAICFGSTVYLIFDFLHLRKLVQNGDCKITEGIVENFRPKTFWSKQPEYFTVSGDYFEYSNTRLSNGYNQIKGNGGIIENDLKVRVHHHKGKILKLEIQR